MHIKLNDQSREIEAGTTLEVLLFEQGLTDTRGFAVAVGGRVVPKSQLSSRVLTEGDEVLLIRASQGG